MWTTRFSFKPKTAADGLLGQYREYFRRQGAGDIEFHEDKIAGRLLVQHGGFTYVSDSWTEAFRVADAWAKGAAAKVRKTCVICGHTKEA